MIIQQLTPPPELVQQWRTEGHHQDYCTTLEHVAAQAARWGADTELEECCEWLEGWVGNDSYAKPLRAARRPQPQPPRMYDNRIDAAIREYLVTWADSLRARDQGLEQEEDGLLEKLDELHRRIGAALPKRPAVTPAADDRGPGSVAEQDSSVAPYDNRLVIAEALRAEADGNDDKCHLVWVTSHELRKVAKILRGEESVAVPAVTTPVKHDWGEWPPERILRAADDEVGPMCEDPGYQRTRAAMAAAVKPVPSLGTMPDTPAVTPDPAPTADGWEKLGGAVHPGTVTTYTVPNPPEPAAAPGDRPLWPVLNYVLSKADSNRSGIAAMLRTVADLTDHRGAKRIDLDSGEVADWLRAEADRAENS